MESVITQLNEIGWFTIVLAIILVIELIPKFVDGWNKFLNSLGLTSKKSIIDKQREKDFNDFKEVIKTEQSSFQNELTNRQTMYHEQSVQIRNELKNKQETFERQQNKMQEDITALTKLLQEYIEKDRERTVATLRSSLWRMHRDFTIQGYITPDGLKTFKEMGKVYEDAGGDDIYHDKLEPEVLNLEIRYIDE